MDLIKLKKLAGITSVEKLFGIHKGEENYYNQITKDADAATGYDDDSISSMVDCCSTAADDLSSAAEMYEDMADAVEEWRSLALDLWENLDKDKQEDYVSFYKMKDPNAQAVHKAFKLEDLKKL